MRLLLCLILIVNTAFSKPVVKSKISKEELISYMDSVGIKYTDIVWAQAKIESGNFSSKLFRYNNNIFGMRVAKSRKHTSIGKRFGYAIYPNWKASVMDYKYFQDHFIGKIASKKDYFRYLDKYYSRSRKYSKTIKKLL